MDMVMRLCNPVIVMAQGKVVMQGTPDEVRSDPRVVEAYLGDQP
jgi:branched-chain amino acid transport system ATP-binding protein